MVAWSALIRHDLGGILAHFLLIPRTIPAKAMMIAATTPASRTIVSDELEEEDAGEVMGLAVFVTVVVICAGTVCVCAC